MKWRTLESASRPEKGHTESAISSFTGFTIEVGTRSRPP
jgi:hypothetical protein